jgi:hypothetical protein
MSESQIVLCGEMYSEPTTSFLRPQAIQRLSVPGFNVAAGLQLSPSRRLEGTFRGSSF